MAGVANHPFRILAKEYGCGLLFSEMVSARGLLYGTARSRFLLYFSEQERPIAIQLFGSEPALMAEAARLIESTGADIIDLNLGCPTPKIVRNGDGGALMRDPGRCSAVFKAVVRAVSLPVTVKMRKGWDERSANAPEIAARAADAGIKAVTVHGRTVQQGYRGRADWDIIRQVKKTAAVPVFGNGDVASSRDASAMLDYCGCDGVMIGRAALGNPWIFAQVRAWLEERREVPPPAPAERAAMALRHLSLLCGLKGEFSAVREMRRHAGWYIKGLPGAHRARQRLNRARSFVEMEAVLRDLGGSLE
jgi:nifR3 family TIM-barrel protein